MCDPHQPVAGSSAAEPWPLRPKGLLLYRHQCCTMAAAAVLHTLVSHQHTVSSLRLFAGFIWMRLLLFSVSVGWTVHMQHRCTYFSDVCFFPLDFFLALPRPQKVVTSLLAFELFQGYLFSFVGYCLEGMCLRLSAIAFKLKHSFIVLIGALHYRFNSPFFICCGANLKMTFSFQDYCLR